MQVIQQILVTAIFILLIAATATYASVITVNPRAVGEPDKSFAASFIGLDYASVLTQSATGTFTENGVGTFKNFYYPDMNTVVGGTGLNKHYTLSATFSGSGIAAPTPQGFGATFNSFGFQIYADRTLVGYSTGLVSGTAQIVPDSLIHATGQFDVTVTFAPVGGFFGNNIQTAHFEGTNDSYTIGAGSTFYSLHTGSGNLSFGTGLSQSLTALNNLTVEGPTAVANPEPATLLLLASGLAGFVMLHLRRRWAQGKQI